jgi:DmsE family decaheme c-type cytochrome
MHTRLSRAPLLAFAFFTASYAYAAPAAAGYAGSQVCQTCHPEVWSNFYRNPHDKSLASGKEPPEKTGCEGCHGPGADHVESGGVKPISRAFSHLNAPQAMAACLECHAKDLPRAAIRGSEHTQADVVCTNCHSIHHSKTPRFLLARRQTDLCYSCHQGIRAQFEQPSHHRVNEGAMNCSDCHNPHGSFAATWRMGGESSRMLTPAFDTEQPCLRCHVDKRGPFVFEHASVRVEGCTACHVSHGTTNARLLRRPVVFTMCLECHNGAGTFGRENSGVFATSTSHNLLDPRYQRCTLCHVRIHGSNSDPTFLR